jgi:hypothetical protein
VPGSWLAGTRVGLSTQRGLRRHASRYLWATRYALSPAARQRNAPPLPRLPRRHVPPGRAQAPPRCHQRSHQVVDVDPATSTAGSGCLHQWKAEWAVHPGDGGQLSRAVKGDTAADTRFTSPPYQSARTSVHSQVSSQHAAMHKKLVAPLSATAATYQSALASARPKRTPYSPRRAASRMRGAWRSSPAGKRAGRAAGGGWGVWCMDCGTEGERERTKGWDSNPQPLGVEYRVLYFLSYRGTEGERGGARQGLWAGAYRGRRCRAAARLWCAARGRARAPPPPRRRRPRCHRLTSSSPAPHSARAPPTPHRCPRCRQSYWPLRSCE